MFRKVTTVSLVSFVFLLCVMACECFADASAKLEQAKSGIVSLINGGNYSEAKTKTQRLIADFPNDQAVPEKLYEIAHQYEEGCKFKEEQDVYQQIIQNYPDISLSSRARIGVLKTEVQSLIASKKNKEAEEALGKLVADFSKHPDLPNTLYEIGERYRWTFEYEKAEKVYKLITKNHPDSSYSRRAQLALSRTEVESLIVSKNYDQAKKNTKKLISDFSGHPDLPEELYWIARRYGWTDKYEEEMAIHQQVIKDYPDSLYAKKARLGFSRANIAFLIVSKNYDEADKAIDKLIEDFPGHPDLAKSVLESADRYYVLALRLEGEGSREQAKDLFRRVLAIHEIMKSRFPDCLVIADPLLAKGACYRGVGEYEKSIECFQRIIDNWPEYPYAWNAQYLIGCDYEDLKRLKAVSESEADEKIKTVYEKLLKDYPDCLAAQSAQNWLDRHNSKGEGEKNEN